MTGSVGIPSRPLQVGIQGYSRVAGNVLRAAGKSGDLLFVVWNAPQFRADSLEDRTLQVAHSLKYDNRLVEMMRFLAPQIIVQ